MLFDDTYLTIKQNAEASFSDRGSKFIAYAYAITSDADIKTIVAQLKALHPKANHHCWAMRLSADRTVFKVNDDGEPSGTAGRPILNVLLSKNITDTLVVVVRYFGGKLLGVPGLINAYKSATELALAEAGVTEKIVTDTYSLEFDYPQMNEVMKVIKDENLQILSQTSDLKCSFTIAIRKSKINQTIGRFESINNIRVTYIF
jgi:uncharacterized YigZ family protein